MTQDNIVPITVDSETSLSALMEQLKQLHPAYYRAWKSMNTTYGVDSVSPQWRGTNGFATFIAETSKLPNSPTQLPGVKVKLKRKVSGFQFDADNTYWKLPSHIRASDKKKVTPLDLSELPKSTGTKTDLPSISELKEKYPTINAIEQRIEELFNKSMTDGLSANETLELDILGKLAIDDEIPVPPASKYEDI
mgnify:CR=1 FL=1